MAKIQRKTQKIFAGNATSDQITAFGTAKNTSPTYTTDLNAIQTNVYTQGWTPSLMSDLAPYLQDSNALWYLVTTQLAYLFQQGIAEWDSSTEYTQGSLVSKYNNGKLELYVSLQNLNINHQLTESNYWRKYNLDGDSSIGQPIIRLDDTLLDGEIRLEGATISRTTYAELFAIYGTTYGAGDGSTTFQLPDFRNRAIWGADSFGYLSAGLPNITGYLDGIENPSTIGGAFYKQGTATKAGAIGEGDYIIRFDAHRSNTIYGNSTTVQPPAIKVRVVTRYII